MTNHNRLISDKGKALLGSLRGKTLKSIEGYRYDLDPSDDETTLYSVARLHMEDGSAYDLQVALIRVDIAEDLWDDVGTYSFKHAEGDIWLPEGIKSFKLPICRKVDEAILVNDYDVLAHEGKEENPFEFTKGVLFQAKLEYIALAIDDFGEDAIIIRRGFDLKELAPDGSGSWYDEPGWTDEYSRKLELP